MFATIDRAITDGETTGMIKVVCEPNGNRILGVHILGADAANLIHEYVLAMQENIPLKRISNMTHIYPTLAEINKKVADSQWAKNFFSEKTRRLRRLVSRFV